MKKVFIMAFAAIAFAFNASAQNEAHLLQNLDLEEDTTDVTSLNDIIAMQQRVLSSSNSEKHYNDVWRRRSFFNLTKNSTTLESEGKVATGEGKSDNISLVNDWGFGMQAGTNYRLHKKPIAHMVVIGLDYSWLDLNVNHFKADDFKKYDSSEKFKDEEGESKFYMPWCLEKYEANYGMSLGPSVTVAPFVPLNIKQLDYFRLQAYYHIGYSASFMYSLNDEAKDNSPSGTDHDIMADNLKIVWGHGLYKTFGINLTWKGIGFGYEHRTGTYEYQPLSTADFGKGKNKFNNSVNRLILQFRL